MNIASEYKSDAIFYAGFKVLKVFKVLKDPKTCSLLPCPLPPLNKKTAANFAAVIVGRD